MNNPIKSHKFLFSIFLLTFIIFLVSAICTTRGILLDGVGQFMPHYTDIVEGKVNYFSRLLQKPYNEYTFSRFFAFELGRLIYILFFPFFKSLHLNFGLYTFSLFTMPVICLILNFVTAQRTKRYDIAVCAFASFCFFSIPYYSFLTRESLVAVMIQYIFLQYFLTKQEKFTTLDYILISLICIFLFESFENMAILGVLLFIFGIIIFLKNKRKLPLILGSISLIITLYITTKAIYTTEHAPYIKDYYKSIIPWVDYLKMYPDAIIKSQMWLTFGAIIITFICSFIKRDLNKKDIIWIALIIIVIAIFLNHFTLFIPYPGREANCFLNDVLIVPIIFGLILYSDVFKDNFLFREKFFNRLFVIACITGILQFAWQINSSKYCYQYVKDIKTTLNNASKPFIIIHYNTHPNTKDIFGCALRYESNIDYFIKSIIISDKYKMKSINMPDYNYIFEDTDEQRYVEYKDVYYDKSKNYLYFKGQHIPVKTKYWDLTSIAEEFYKLNITEPIESEKFLDILKKNDKILYIEM